MHTCTSTKTHFLAQLHAKGRLHVLQLRALRVQVNPQLAHGYLVFNAFISAGGSSGLNLEEKDAGNKTWEGLRIGKM
jgi:hypothetical protein